MATEKKLPFTTCELIDLLNTIYPEKSPDPSDTEREIWMKAGERRLVRRLTALKGYIRNETTITESGGFIA